MNAIAQTARRRLLSAGSQVIHRRRRQGVERRGREIAQLVLPDLRLQLGSDGWRLGRVFVGESRAFVLGLQHPQEDPLVLKVSDRPEMVPELANGAAVLHRLHSIGLDESITRAIPESISVSGHCCQRVGQVPSATMSLEQHLPGAPMDSFPLAPWRCRAVLRSTVVMMSRVYDATGDVFTLSPDRLESWTAPEWEIVDGALGLGAMPQSISALMAPLVDRRARLATVHGDLHPGNVLVDASITDPAAQLDWTPFDETNLPTGIIDWDQSSDQQPPALDGLRLVLFCRRAQGMELGDVFNDVLTEGLLPWEASLLRDDVRDADELRAFLTLMWLRTVAGTLRREPRFAKHRYWIRKNVTNVLNELALQHDRRSTWVAPQPALAPTAPAAAAEPQPSANDAERDASRLSVDRAEHLPGRGHQPLPAKASARRNLRARVAEHAQESGGVQDAHGKRRPRGPVPDARS